MLKILGKTGMRRMHPGPAKLGRGGGVPYKDPIQAGPFPRSRRDGVIPYYHSSSCFEARWRIFSSIMTGNGVRHPLDIRLSSKPFQGFQTCIYPIAQSADPATVPSTIVEQKGTSQTAKQPTRQQNSNKSTKHQPLKLQKSLRQTSQIIKIVV